MVICMMSKKWQLLQIDRLDNRLFITSRMLSQCVSLAGVKHVLKLDWRPKPASFFGDENEMSQFSYRGEIAFKLWPFFTAIFVKNKIPFSHLDRFFLPRPYGWHSLETLVWIFHVRSLWSVSVLILILFLHEHPSSPRVGLLFHFFDVV